MLKKPLSKTAKILFLAIVFLLITGGIYFVHKIFTKEEKIKEPKTIILEKQTIKKTISATGQVKNLKEIDITPEVSGKVDFVNVEVGDKVKRGDIILKLDTSDALKEINNTRTDLETAKLELEEMISPPDDYELMQAEHKLENARNSLEKLKREQASEQREAKNNKRKANDDLETTYEDAFNNVSNAYLDLPDIMSNLEDILDSYEIGENNLLVSENQDNTSVLINSTYKDYKNDMKGLVDIAVSDYNNSREKYEDTYKDYKNTSRYSENSKVENLLSESISTIKSVSQAIKSITNMIDSWKDYRTQKDWPIFQKVEDYRTKLSSFTATTNNHLTSLLSIEQNIETYKENKEDAIYNLEEMEENHPIKIKEQEQTIEELEQSLKDLKLGATNLEIRKQKIVIQEKEDVLQEARENFNDHYIKASFNGKIGEINIEEGESVSNSNSIAILISNEKVAELTLNEVDVAKVEKGDKVEFSFDAIENLKMTGEVMSIDTIGEVSQGVVNYGFKMNFDKHNDQIKPGMTVVCDIIIDQSKDAIVVSSSLIKSKGQAKFIQILDNEKPVLKKIETGISNETKTEITKGLEVGDKIITNTAFSPDNNSNSQGNDSNSQGDINNKPQNMPGSGMMRMMR